MYQISESYSYTAKLVQTVNELKLTNEIALFAYSRRY